MLGSVGVEEQSAYQAWLQEQPTFAETLAQAERRPGDGLTLPGDGLTLSERAAQSAEREPPPGVAQLTAPDKSEAKRVF